MKKTLLLPLLVIVFAVFAPTSVYPASKTKTKATPVPIYHTTIGSISADSITVNLPNKKTATYKITLSTEIYYEGKKVAANALQSGMRVSVSPASMNADAAGTILASAPPKSPPIPKK
jgi:hypothetical protein